MNRTKHNDILRAFASACCLALAVSCAQRQALDRPAAEQSALDLVGLATLRAENGDIAGAIAQLKRARTFDPGSPLIHLMIAQYYYELGNDTLAGLYAGRAVRLDPGNADGRLVLGNSHLLARRYDEALAQYLAAARLKPQSSEIAVTLAQLYEATGQPDSAVALLRREIERSGDPGARQGLAGLLTRLRQWPAALDQYRGILEADSTDLKALYSAGLLFEVTDQPDSAVAYFDRVSARQPANAAIRRRIFNALLGRKDFAAAALEAQGILELEPGDANMRLQLARIHYRQGEFDRAAGAFEALLSSDSANTEALYTLARLRLQQKRYDDAAVYFRRTLAILPRVTEAWINLGVCQLQLGQRDSAEHSFKRARRHGSKMERDYLFGFAYAQLDRHAEALPHYLSVLPKHRRDPAFLFNLAAAYERSGDFETAERWFKELLARDPGHASAQNYLGYMYAERGVRLDEAEALIAKALSQEPDNAYYIDSMGWVFFRLGRLDEARASIERAVALLPRDATLREHLGDIYLAQGDRERAVGQWRIALEIDPAKASLRGKIADPPGQ